MDHLVPLVKPERYQLLVNATTSSTGLGAAAGTGGPSATASASDRFADQRPSVATGAGGHSSVPASERSGGGGGSGHHHSDQIKISLTLLGDNISQAVID